MLQKRNDFEIIILLTQEPRHIRKISSELALIPSTAMRILRRLERENVIEYSMQGKNKVYKLKNSPEKDQYLLMSEHYRTLKQLQQPVVRRITKKLKELTNGELIILFGSRIKGTAHEKSDIDIYIETTDKSIKKKAELISKDLRITIGKFDKTSVLGKEMIKHHVIIQNPERLYQLLQ
ncbi:MAG: nucleotidyltransferase domain-containing protein [Nanobdellota archaeon]